MALIQNGARANGTAEVVDGHLQVSQEHTPPGFVAVQFVAWNFTASAAEALLSMQAYRDFVASGAAATSFAVTAGKKLKIVSADLSVRNAGAAQQNLLCALRVNPTGAVTAAQVPVVASLSATTPGATAGLTSSFDETFGDHLLLSGTQQLGVTNIGTAAAGNYLVIRGYEFTE